jgi:hypothetical protein
MLHVCDQRFDVRGNLEKILRSRHKSRLHTMAAGGGTHGVPCVTAAACGPHFLAACIRSATDAWDTYIGWVNN